MIPGPTLRAVLAVFLAVTSALAIGMADFIGGRAARTASPTGLVAMAQAIDLALLLVLTPLFGSDASGRDLWIGAAAGAAGSVAFAIFLAALARGPMSLVSPFTALIGVATPVLAGLWLGERPSTLLWIGVLLGMAAIGLTSTPPRKEGPEPSKGRGKTLFLAALAGLGFAAFVIGLDQTSADAGLAPLVSARAAGLLALVPYMLVRREPWPSGDQRVAAVQIGLLETLAIAALITALHGGELVPVSVLSSLYPVVTVLLAVMLLQERLERIHRAGVALALVALVIIAAT